MPSYLSACNCSFSVALLFAMPCASVAGFEMPGDADEARASEDFQQYAQRTAAAFQIEVGVEDSQTATMYDQPVLRWTNPVGGRVIGHGEMFLWTAQGRPIAVLGLYRYPDAAGRVMEHHEFSSLALHRLTATKNGRAWSPADAGVEFLPIPDAPLPLDAPPLRLRQMRELAARFSADKTNRQDIRSPLRLLTQPLHRYETEPSGILDGALFAFVEGTDPEVLLLIEAQSTDAGYAWHYAFARMTSVQLRAFYREGPVWEVPTLAWREVLNRPDKSYAILTQRVE